MCLLPGRNPLIALLFFLCILVPVSAMGVFTNTFTEEDLLEKFSVFTGDFDEMAEERFVRILIPYNRAFFFFDGAQPKGISYEATKLFENFINKKLKTKTLKVKVIAVPAPREKLFDWLIKGKGDIAIGNLTITEERRRLVDFSDPFAKNISEIVVTEKKQKTLKNVFDLAGMEIHVRKSSSYYEHLKNLNAVLQSSGKKEIKIVEANELLEDSDLLEMINAGLIPAIVMDEHKVDLWKQVFENIHPHPQVKVNSGGQIGWAFRKNSPQLKSVINEFIKKNKAGTLTANVIINRYLKNASYITNSTRGEEIKKFERTVKYFKAYGDKYSFDHLMLAALAYQESRLDQSMKSHVGAVGVMQMLPSTAKDQNVGIPNITELDPNIHAGTKYLRFMADRYFPEEKGFDTLNRALFTFAAYNAGPARVASLRREAEKMGLDSNIWFNNVEVVAAKRIGRETVQYVSNIMKYYIAYKLLEEKMYNQVQKK